MDFPGTNRDFPGKNGGFSIFRHLNLLVPCDVSELHKICVKGDSGSRYFCGSAWVILNMIQTIQRHLILLGEHGGYIRKAHSLRDSLTATAFIPEVVCIKRDMAAVRSRFDQQAG